MGSAGWRAWAQGPQGRAWLCWLLGDLYPTLRGTQWHEVSRETPVSQPSHRNVCSRPAPDGEQQNPPEVLGFWGAGSSLSSLEQEPQDGTSTLLRELKRRR